MPPKKRLASKLADGTFRQLKRTKTGRESSEAQKNGTNLTPHILNVPGELRNKIYEYVIEEHLTGCGDKKTINAMEDIDGPVTLAYEPKLSKVSRQIRKEVLALFYGNNNFRFGLYGYQVAPFLRWVKILDPSYAAMIPGIELALHCEYDEDDYLEDILPGGQKMLVAIKQAICLMQVKEKYLSHDVQFKIQGCFLPHFKTFLSACKMVAELRRGAVHWNVVRRAVKAAHDAGKSVSCDYTTL